NRRGGSNSSPPCNDFQGFQRSQAAHSAGTSEARSQKPEIVPEMPSEGRHFYFCAIISSPQRLLPCLTLVTGGDWFCLPQDAMAWLAVHAGDRPALPSVSREGMLIKL